MLLLPLFLSSPPASKQHEAQLRRKPTDECTFDCPLCKNVMSSTISSPPPSFCHALNLHGAGGNKHRFQWLCRGQPSWQAGRYSCKAHATTSTTTANITTTASTTWRTTTTTNITKRKCDRKENHSGDGHVATGCPAIAQRGRPRPGPGPVYCPDFRALGPKICIVYRSGARPGPVRSRRKCIEA